MTEPVVAASSLDLSFFQEKMAELAHVGLAIFDLTSSACLFSNRAFHTTLGSPDQLLFDALKDNDEFCQALETLEPGQVVHVDFPLKKKRRTLALTLHLNRIEVGGQLVLLVELQNDTRLRELESMIESYSRMVERNERELKREKERADKLLLNVMPQSVLEELKEYGVSAPQKFEDASVLMLDFVAFTEMPIADDPTKTIAELNDIFTNFDRIVEQFGCERIKTIGDAYMAVSGVPERHGDHATAIAKTAQLFIRYLERRNQAHTIQWCARIGLASGPVIGSIVGVYKYVYDIFGPAVNLATRMERRCNAMEIMLCEPMASALANEFRLISRGIETVKGFGDLEMFVLSDAY